MRRIISWSTLLRRRKEYVGGQIRSIEDTHEYIGNIERITFSKKTGLISFHCSWVAGRPKHNSEPWTMAWTTEGGHTPENAMNAGFNGTFATNIDFATPARSGPDRITFTVMYNGERILRTSSSNWLLQRATVLDKKAA